MAAKKSIPGHDRVMRFVPYGQQDRDPETDAYRGLTAGAFELRESDEGGLSVTWIEFFGPESPANIRAGALAHRETLTSKRLPAKGLFAFAIAESIVEVALPIKKLRVVHAPVTGNPGHAEIRHFTDEDLELLELISTEAFSDSQVVFVKDLELGKPSP